VARSAGGSTGTAIWRECEICIFAELKQLNNHILKYSMRKQNNLPERGSFYGTYFTSSQLPKSTNKFDGLTVFSSGGRQNAAPTMSRMVAALV